MNIIRKLMCLLFLGLLFHSESEGQNMNSDAVIQSQNQSGFIEVENGKLYYEQAGEGEVIVFLHDGLIHSIVWDKQFKYFSKTNRVISYDRRGYGKSPLPEKPYSNVEDLNQIFESLKIEKAILMSMSAGSRLAIDYTIIFPEKVKMLILVGPVVSGFELTNHFYTRGGFLPPNLDPTSDAYRNYYAKVDPYEIWEGNIATRKLTKEILEANPHNTEPSIFQLEQGPDRPAISALHEINIPAIILAGEYDMPDIHAHAGAIAAGITKSVRTIIPKAGHRIPMEQPDVLIENILNLMGKLKFQEIENNDGVAAAIDTYRKDRQAGIGSYKVSENDINGKGYNYLFNGKAEEALLFFKLNVEEYPNSANVYDSYGEALMTLGDTAQAIINYEKSLKLNPENNNAVEMLKKLRKE